MARNKIFLDIDGVLRLLVFTPPSGTYCSGEARYAPEAEPIKVIWDPRVIDFINEMHVEDNNIDFYFLSSWGDCANTEFGALVELEKLPVIQPPEDVYDEEGCDFDWWKFKAIEEEYSRTDGFQKFAWIDDDLALEYKVTLWCRTKRIYPAYPKPHMGVNVSDLKSAINYLNRNDGI